VRSFFLAPSRICHLCVCVQCSDDQIDGQVRREEALDRRSSIDRHLWMGDEICSRPIRRGSHHKFIARAPRTYETRRVCLAVRPASPRSAASTTALLHRIAHPRRRSSSAGPQPQSSPSRSCAWTMRCAAMSKGKPLSCHRVTHAQTCYILLSPKASCMMPRL
jgi:hypothetical protein